jgi:hypothetical protein
LYLLTEKDQAAAQAAADAENSALGLSATDVAEISPA